MENIKLKTDDIYGQAAYWFTLFESGRTTVEQKMTFEIWVNEKAEHEKAFEEIKSLSGNMRALSVDIHNREKNQDTELSRTVRQAATRVKLLRKRKKSLSLGRRVASIAAAIIVSLGGLWLWQWPALNEGVTSYQTAIGEQKTVMLSDGSLVTLNTDSELSVAMTDNLRRLHLIRGEVYFEVAKDKNRPFEVAVQKAFVKAVGTAFNIHHRDAEVSILVTEGKVEVKSKFAPLSPAQEIKQLSEKKEFLVTGDQIIFGREKLKRIQLEEKMINRRTLWREGKIILDNKSLAEIVREIQPYTTEKIVIADEEVAILIAGGVFKMGEINSFFNALESALPVKIVRQKGIIILTRRQDKGQHTKQRREI